MMGPLFPLPRTHLMAAPTSLRIPMKFDPAFDPRRTEFLSRYGGKMGHLEGVLTNHNGHHIYGYIGMSDRRIDAVAASRQHRLGGWVSAQDR